MRLRLLLLLGGIALAVALAELGLRVFPVPAVEVHRRQPASSEHALFFQYDAQLGWRGRPHAHGHFAGWEFASEVTLNARGFRDREVGRKAPGVFRVVVLGDSITWGYGVGTADRYPDLLEALLRDRGILAEVVNLSVSGYGTDQEYLLFQAEGGQYCADLVLLGLYANDVHENVARSQGRYPKPYFRVEAAGDLTLANVPVPRTPAWAGAGPPESSPGAGLTGFLRRHAHVYGALGVAREALRQWRREDPTDTAPPAEALDVTAQLLRQLAGAAEQDGARYLVVVLPDLRWAGWTADAARRAGLSNVLDLTPDFRAAAPGDGRLFYRLDGAHWTPRAHHLAARLIADRIVRSRTLTGAPRTCEV